jgi:hypothetical protein
MADTRSFTVTPAQLDGLVALLETHGLVLDPASPTGEVKTGGWDVSWEQQPGTITITLVQHPFLEAGAFWSKVNAVLNP